jgi:hypothetical protein
VYEAWCKEESCAALKDAQINPEREECALNMGQRSNKGAVS